MTMIMAMNYGNKHCMALHLLSSSPRVCFAVAVAVAVYHICLREGKVSF